MLGYLNAYHADDASYPLAAIEPALHEMARCVIKLGIMVMADFIA